VTPSDIPFRKISLLPNFFAVIDSISSLSLCNTNAFSPVFGCYIHNMEKIDEYPLAIIFLEIVFSKYPLFLAAADLELII